MARKRQVKKATPIEQLAEEKIRSSRQPRFNNQDRTSIFWSTYTWAKRAMQEEPQYAPNSPKRDKWLREYVLGEPFLHGVLASVTSVDKNRGWSMLGAEHIVRDYVERFHGLHASPDQKGWRPFTSFMSQAYHGSDLGAVAEIEWKAVNLNGGFNGQLNSLYTVDPVQCRLTGDVNYPLSYSANELGLGPQDWSTNAYFRLVDGIYPDVNFNGLGVCAISRALELAKILTALYEHDAEQLLSKAPRGLLLLNGISEEQWESTLEARGQSMSELEKRYYTGVQVFAGNGLEKVQAELVSLSKIPDNLDHVSFTNLVMNLYALAFKYDPREFWPVSSGQLGTATETDTQHKKATGKGGMDFILAYQENLQNLLPSTLEFEFEARDVDGEIKDENLTTLIVNNIVALATAKFITEEQARVMLAEAEIIHKDWASTSFMTTTDQEDSPEGDNTQADFLTPPAGSLFAKPSPQDLFGAKTKTLSFLNSPAGASSLSFLQKQKSPIADFLKKRNSKLVLPETEERLEDLIEVDKEVIARSLFHFPNQRIVKYVERAGIGSYQAIELKRKARTYSFTDRGSKGKGNWGHKGRPGEVGGSGGGVALSDIADWEKGTAKTLATKLINEAEGGFLDNPKISYDHELLDKKNGSTVVGIAHINKSNRNNNVTVGVISTLAINPKYQGKGEGSAFVKDMITKFQADGLTEIQVVSQDALSDQFWKSQGFVKYGENISGMSKWKLDISVNRDKRRQDITNHDGSMIALFIPEAVAKQLRQIADNLNLPKNSKQETWDNMHLTLTFFPDVDFEDDALRNAAVASIELALKDLKISSPLSGIIQGYGVFNGSEDGPVLYASLDVPELNALRAKMCEYLDKAALKYATNHGFTPHITLAYLGNDFTLPKGFSIPDIGVSLDAVYVVNGKNKKKVPFQVAREGKGKGNWGHSGRPGEVGGSGEGNGNAPDGIKTYKTLEDMRKADPRTAKGLPNNFYISKDGEFILQNNTEHFEFQKSLNEEQFQYIFGTSRPTSYTDSAKNLTKGAMRGVWDEKNKSLNLEMQDFDLDKVADLVLSDKLPNANTYHFDWHTKVDGYYTETWSLSTTLAELADAKGIKYVPDNPNIKGSGAVVLRELKDETLS